MVRIPYHLRNSISSVPPASQELFHAPRFKMSGTVHEVKVEEDLSRVEKYFRTILISTAALRKRYTGMALIDHRCVRSTLY